MAFTSSVPNLEINLKKFRHSLSDIQSKIGPNRRIMLSIKANAYGHGAVPMAKAAVPQVAMFGIAHLEEAIALRNANIQTQILALSALPLDNFAAARNISVIHTLHNLDYARTLDAFSVGHPTVAHIKVDTGMGRLGFLPDQLRRELPDLLDLKNLHIAGLYTHFSRADFPNDPYTLQQIERFDALLADIRHQLPRDLIVHAANSGGIQNYPQAYYDMVRPGLMAYKGIQVLSARITEIRDLPAGHNVGYLTAYTTTGPSHVAVVHAGYADGVPVSLSNKGAVRIRNRIYPIAGRVCMDMLMVDLDNNPDGITTADRAILLDDGTPETSAETMADLSGRSLYEIYCGISPRVSRTYF
jgi:alanine racemase